MTSPEAAVRAEVAVEAAPPERPTMGVAVTGSREAVGATEEPDAVARTEVCDC